MNPLTLRELAEHNLLALLGLYAELHPTDAPLPGPERIHEVWQAILCDPKLHGLGGFINDVLVTTCTLMIVPNLTRACRPYALIENVVTATTHRHHGYGRVVLQHACDIAWQHACYKVMLMTSRKDDATLAFYESAGFDRHTKQAFYVAAPQDKA